MELTGKEELNKTDYFEFDTEIKSENNEQETESSKAFHCQFCNYQSKYRSHVTVHENSVHLMQKFFVISVDIWLQHRVI